MSSATKDRELHRRPLRIVFLLTSMPVGGAETLLVNLLDRLDRSRFDPEVCCLKAKGPLGERISERIPVHCEMTRGKYDVAVLGKLTKLMKSRKYDAAITVGCGDKMFWGRLAAKRAGVPVIASALHSTGWPDRVGHLNRWLTGITDAFIGVARSHGEHLVHGERFPREKVFVIPNGVDTQRFSPCENKSEMRQSLNLPDALPLVTIVAALRPEKNHRRFLDIAKSVCGEGWAANFLIVGDGPEKNDLEDYAEQQKITEHVTFLGNRSDIPQILAASDVFMLTSDNEAAPVSIMEAMACALPVVASNVGSVHEMVLDGETGFVCPLDTQAFARRLGQLLSDPDQMKCMGQAGRNHVVSHGSLEAMVAGYEDLIESLYTQKMKSMADRHRQILVDTETMNAEVIPVDRTSNA